jgi:hypothetical protein
MVSDLIESSLVGHKLEGLLFGGAPAPDSLVPRARSAFPGATMYVPPNLSLAVVSQACSGVECVRAMHAPLTQTSLDGGDAHGCTDTICIT